MFSISKYYTEFQIILSGKFNFKDLIKFIVLIPNFIRRSIDLKKIKKEIIRKKFTIEDAIIITSEERSGSTWLIEILNSSNKIVVNWEPFHEKLGVLPAKFNFGVRPFIDENKKDNEFKKIFKEIFEFKRSNYWTTNFLKLNQLKTAEFVLTKTVKFNLSLPWLVNNFKFKKKPVLLLRHPIPVILSQEKNFKQNIYKDYILSNSYNNKRFIKHKNYLESLDTKLEKRMAIWCLNNISTINNPLNKNKWMLIYYENMLLNPKDELRIIEKEYNIHLNWGKIDLKKTSSSSRRPLKSTEEQLSSWCNQISIIEKEKIQEVFNYFNLKIYSAFNTMPQF